MLLLKNRNKIFNYFANEEVVLSAGSINTPQILELSGIGQKSIIQKNEINLVHELKGVGENLRDHIVPRLIFEIKQRNITFNDKARGFNLIKQGLKYLFNRNGFFSSPSAPLIGFYKTKPEFSNPDVQLHFVPYRIIFKKWERILSKNQELLVPLIKTDQKAEGLFIFVQITHSSIQKLNLIFYHLKLILKP